jgi:hypothetical protein
MTGFLGIGYSQLLLMAGNSKDNSLDIPNPYVSQ